jgi:hypothetical protein
MLHIDTYMRADEAASKRPLMSAIFATSIYSAAFQVSKMQKPVALSAARAERCAASEMAIELLTFALAASIRPESESRAWDFRTESAITTESQQQHPIPDGVWGHGAICTMDPRAGPVSRPGPGGP